MSSLLYDTQGNRFRIEGVLDSGQDSYASLFSTAVTYRARHVGTYDDDVVHQPSSPPSAHQGQSLSTPSRPHSISATVVITYIPLLSSLQGITSSKDAAALLVLQDHVRLRRQVEHPFLRSLFDVFYTQQCLAAPVSSSGPPAAAATALVRRPVEVHSPVASRARKQQTNRSASAEEDRGVDEANDGDTADRKDVAARSTTSTASSPSHTDSGTALVIVEEFIEGSTLADYADAVACKRLMPGNVKLQRDAAAIAYQLAQLLQYLHGTGCVLCRELPLGNIALDQNKGYISVRLPLGAVNTLHEADDKRYAHSVAALVFDTSQLHREKASFGAEEYHLLRAPELRHVACWDAVCDPAASPTTDNEPAAFGAADVWMLGVVTTLLCTLNNKKFALTTRAERLAAVHSHIDHLPGLLPSDTPEGMVKLIQSCLESSPAKRPTATGVLTSAAFVPNRSHVELEQQRAVISIAEAVANANKRKMPPPSLHLAENSAATTGGGAAAAAATALRTVAVAPDNELTLLSLQGTVWYVPTAYRDVLLPGADVALPGEPATLPHIMQVPSSVAPSLSRATQDAFHDIERLCEQDARLRLTDLAAAPSYASTDCKRDSLQERLRRSKLMPRDFSATKCVLEELTDRFTQLESRNPEAAFCFIELLLEGLQSCSQGVAALRESVTLADALLQPAGLPPTGTLQEETPAREDACEDSTLSNSTEVGQRDFQVPEVLRAMPSMPERMIASDRAANTSAVLYNQWLRKNKKRFVKSDGY
ncbi:hypothetical protein ABB37_00512 [Leptomonas pyrrhocoris]|uniref:Protein kinase domain-containing protein n=1 Tax=Leptomonas pyrrhocoris TaxID=157538 RepID=A0A0M9GAW1_LEPPY|nr:hypothetical protein ABB37_00512 [Leptomonas pyrrhocoris]KPA86286.1 hypothetical protein ABB37_00512 [Leptomonas pyrrhocoris]|eukprot:XP_015664725.1 hypothetical protein ABB37_00512 [Leptomonas pyrrhocoris]